MRIGADLLLVTRLLEAGESAIRRSTLTNRLRDLCAGSHSASTTARTSTERNRAFELICAGWLSRFATDVALEDPPDVSCSFDWRRWGVACKVAYGEPRTIAKSIAFGAEQLQKSPCDRGIVLVRITDCFPHDRVPGFDRVTRTILSAPDSVTSFNYVQRLAREHVVDPVIEAVGRKWFDELREKQPKLDAIVFVGHTTIHLHGPEGGVLTMSPMQIVEPEDRESQPFVQSLFRALSL